MTPQQATEQATAIRWIVIGTIVAEYGCGMLPPSKGELKMRTNAVVSASRKLQSYFLHHPQASPQAKEIFKHEFIKNEIVLIGDLLETIWGIPEDDLENIILTLKENIEQT